MKEVVACQQQISKCYSNKQLGDHKKGTTIVISAREDFNPFWLPLSGLKSRKKCISASRAYVNDYTRAVKRGTTLPNLTSFSKSIDTF